jgi:serine/threonine-protein kinase HipA
MENKIFTYVDLQGQSHLVGTLWIRQVKGKESASFEYDESWLNNKNKFALEPALSLNEGGFHTGNNKALFGAIGDSSPDRWGRVLVQREERRKARVEDRSPKTLSEADYLLGVGDLTRLGALRFSIEKGGEFLANKNKSTIPPLIRLSELLNAATKIISDEESDSDLQLILAPGSSLGGARAKASIIDNNGNLSIAKFPQPDDTWPVTLWEIIALDLANEAGISVSKRRLEQIGKHSVLLLDRFDREGKFRIPFISAMSMIGAADNEAHSYLEIADSIRTYGSKPEDDLKQLWRRIVFNILISDILKSGIP